MAIHTLPSMIELTEIGPLKGLRIDHLLKVSMNARLWRNKLQTFIHLEAHAKFLNMMTEGFKYVQAVAVYFRIILAL